MTGPLPPPPHPIRCHMTVHDVRVPLLPVFVGVLNGRPVPTWVLYVHPDWPEEQVAIVEWDPDGDPPRDLSTPPLWIDQPPAGCAVELNLDFLPREGRVVIGRHPG